MSYRKSSIFGKITSGQKKEDSPFAALDNIQITDSTPKPEVASTVVPELKINKELPIGDSRFPWISELDVYLSQLQPNQGFDIPIEIIKGDIPDKRGEQPTGHPRVRQFDSSLRGYIRRNFPKLKISLRCITIDGLPSKHDQGGKLASLRVVCREVGRKVGAVDTPTHKPVPRTTGKKVQLTFKTHVYSYLVGLSNQLGQPVNRVIYQIVEDRMDGKR